MNGSLRYFGNTLYGSEVNLESRCHFQNPMEKTLTNTIENSGYKFQPNFNCVFKQSWIHT